MEPHPVPKNILTVEFKLFGSLTVKQFSKILIGSLAALVVFIMQLPVIIGLPLMVISVLLGILSALVEGFEAKMLGVIKSLFVSPRYVWQKQEKTPEALMDEQIKKQQSTTAKKISKETTTAQVHDISLDKLLDARAARQLEPEPAAASEEDNFARVYGDIYEQELGQPLQPPAAAVQPPAQPGSVAGVQDLTGAEGAPVGAEIPATTNERIIELQARLTEMTNQNASAEQKQPLIDEINEIYGRLRAAAATQLPPTETAPLDQQRMLYGVLVNRSEVPVAGARVSLKSVSDGSTIGQPQLSGQDGRFAIEGRLTPGEYIVHIEHQGVRFPEFKLMLGEGTLPAYKFREG